LTRDPFTTLGVEPRFGLDKRAIAARHRELSRALHPDRFASAPASERRRALNEAINVNQAFRELNDPVRRAELLLARASAGLELAAAGDSASPAADPVFLMKIMELREALSEARNSNDMHAVRTLASDVTDREQSAFAELTALIDDRLLERSPAPAVDSRATLEKARQITSEMRYLRRFIDEVSAIEDELD
jgi:molecular chaperone HscB